jgi:hypothetical protein
MKLCTALTVLSFCSCDASTFLTFDSYATVLEEEGQIYLYIKTIERAHLPSKLWEKIKLHTNYAQALAQITEQLQYWPNFNVHKVRNLCGWRGGPEWVEF